MCGCCISGRLKGIRSNSIQECERKRLTERNCRALSGSPCPTSKTTDKAARNVIVQENNPGTACLPGKSFSLEARHATCGVGRRLARTRRLSSPPPALPGSHQPDVQQAAALPRAAMHGLHGCLRAACSPVAGGDGRSRRDGNASAGVVRVTLGRAPCRAVVQGGLVTWEIRDLL